MATRRSFKTARGLTDLALDYAFQARPLGETQTYEVENDGIYTNTRLVLPMAMHDALCDSDAVLLHDEPANVVVCDKCRTPYENERDNL